MKQEGGRDVVSEHDDDAAIDLDDDEEEEETNPNVPQQQEPTTPAGDEQDVTVQNDKEDDVKNDKKQQMRERLRKLKMKMNQARQLNRQEVMREGERLQDDGGKERKRQAILDKKQRQKEWEVRNGKALDMANQADIDGKYLVEQAGESMRTAMKRADKAEKARFGVKDYYNPEGQYRNYERNLKSLPKAAAGAANSASTNTFNPLTAATSQDKDSSERMGARLLANELHRRIEKQAKNKRNRLEFEGADVTSINERNKRFNQKISRNFDKDTAEIRQNLERGTAL